MSIIRRIHNFLHSRIAGIPILEECQLAGKHLIVRRGTVRTSPDKDDAWLLALARHSHYVLDIGSNIGQAAMNILLSDSVKRIVLVDPNPNALSIAAENVIRNGGARPASFVCAFVSNLGGTSQNFWTVGLGAAGSMYASHAKTAASQSAHYSVPTITVDEINNHLRFEPDLVKIDVEGAEDKVLEGAVELARSGECRFFVEMHSSTELPMRENANRIIGWCSRVNYRAWYLTEHCQLTTPDQIAHRGRCHLLLLPMDAEYPSWIKGIRQGSPIESAFE